METEFFTLCFLLMLREYQKSGICVSSFPSLAYKHWI